VGYDKLKFVGHFPALAPITFYYAELHALSASWRKRLGETPIGWRF